jgi:hypothetical protein
MNQQGTKRYTGPRNRANLWNDLSNGREKRHRRYAPINIRGGGGQNRPWVLGPLSDEDGMWGYGLDRSGSG